MQALRRLGVSKSQILSPAATPVVWQEQVSHLSRLLQMPVAPAAGSVCPRLLLTAPRHSGPPWLAPNTAAAAPTCISTAVSLLYYMEYATNHGAQNVCQEHLSQQWGPACLQGQHPLRDELQRAISTLRELPIMACISTVSSHDLAHTTARSYIKIKQIMCRVKSPHLDGVTQGSACAMHLQAAYFGCVQARVTQC